MYNPKKQIRFNSDEGIDFRAETITKLSQFEKLFKGFHTFRGITYVSSPELILKFFEPKFGFTKMEMVVGDKLVNSYHNTLVDKNIDVTKTILHRITDGDLTIYGTERPIHSKVYLLEGDEKIRIILGSANFTKEARKAYQINAVDVIDINYHSPIAEEIISMYENIYREHLDHCIPFMADLIKKINENIDAEEDEIIQLWLQNTVSNTNASNRDFFGDMGNEALLSDETVTEMKFTIQGPLSAKKHQKKVLKNFSSEYSGDTVSVDRRTYLDQRNHRIPIMKYFAEKNQLMIGLDGEAIQLNKTLSNPEIIDKWLSNIEDYVNCVDFGNAPTPEITKMYMMEALIYLFCSPFANEYLDIRRRGVGEIDSRGPRFLYIYGSSQNGKTTFLKWILKLMLDVRMEPIRGKELKDDYLTGAREIGTAFPLMFDDVPANKWRYVETFFKNHWETEWRPEDTFPQVIFTSNKYNLPEWANTRLKRIEFDVQYHDNTKAKIKLNEIYKENNGIYGNFTSIYMGLLKKQKEYYEDELALGRKVFELLYHKAKRKMPSYFPIRPSEQLHDPDRTRWQKLIYEHKKAKLTKEGNEIYINFSMDMETKSIKEFKSLLPQDVKHKLEGNLLVIQTPDRFMDWIKEGQKTSSKWFFWR